MTSSDETPETPASPEAESKKPAPRKRAAKPRAKKATADETTPASPAVAPDATGEEAPAEKKTGAKKSGKKAAPKKASAKKAAPKKASGKKATGKKKVVEADPADEDDGKGDEALEGKSLVVVESPAKAKTINKFLGKSYVVKASFGHVRDLPKKDMGIDIEHGFEPEYQALAEKKKVITELRRAARTASKVYLACDPDREGEAIAWHISELLKTPPERTFRVTFNEITKSAIEKAFETGVRQIDMAKVNAQQARRLLDRIVGYKLSPLLWKKVKRGLSAGRVQSVAVRIVVDREREIRAFNAIEYWDLEATLAKLDAPPAPPPPPPPPPPKEGEKAEKVEPAPLGAGRFFAKLVQVGDEKLDPQKFRLKDEAEAKALKAEIEAGPFVVSSVKKSERRDNPSPPFITSTLQQQASTRLRFATNKTMRIAQTLYENGLITYMRTDSFALAGEAVTEARDYIKETFGSPYLPDEPRVYKRESKVTAQEAHEAIRPSYPRKTPDSVAKDLGAEELKLYTLIWERFMACQMPAALFAQTSVDIQAGRATFRASGRTMIFDGHLRVGGKKDKDNEPILPELTEAEKLRLDRLQDSQHFTQPPPRYTEASLVQVLEKAGIGRPSTYATITSTIQERGYVKQENRRFAATELGMIVTDRLAKHFHEIMDTAFTSDMESRLDKIEEENVDWRKVLSDFYVPFEKNLETANEVMKGLNENPEESTTPCPKCGRLMVLMWNKIDFNRFLGCPGYKTDECNGTLPVDEKGAVQVPEETDERCPECGSSMQVRTGRRGRFLACSAYPTCKVTREVAEEGTTQYLANLESICKLCGKKMIVRRGMRGPFMGCTGYPECKSTLPIIVGEDGAPKIGEKRERGADMPKIDIKCEKCGSAMSIRRSKRGPFLGCTGYPKCKGTAQVPKDIVIPGPPPPTPLGENCDICGKPMVIRMGRRGPFGACTGYPGCKNTKQLS